MQSSQHCLVAHVHTYTSPSRLALSQTQVAKAGIHLLEDSIDAIIQQQLSVLLVWPKKMVIPLFDPSTETTSEARAFKQSYLERLQHTLSDPSGQVRGVGGRQGVWCWRQARGVVLVAGRGVVLVAGQGCGVCNWPVPMFLGMLCSMHQITSNVSAVEFFTRPSLPPPPSPI